MTRRIAVLGSTGSIGTQTLEVLSSAPESFDVVGLSARTSTDLLRDQAREWEPELVVLTDPEAPAEEFPCPVVRGEDGWSDILRRDLDVMVLSIVGAAGLQPCLEAIERGVDVAIATKEVLVMAGEVVTRRLEGSGARLVPVDSEHNAIFQLLRGEPLSTVRKVYLTASGGPFRDRTRDELKDVTPEEATAHPNWSMGKKISIDSATMMNKGLELIEARYLFDLEPDQVDALIHRQSVVHGLVEYRDHSVMAQCGTHDMKLAIQNALFTPERPEALVERLPFKSGTTWDFEPVDRSRYPAFRLAEQAMERGGTAPAVLNAANEEAVALFLAGETTFLTISRLVRHALETVDSVAGPDLDDIFEADRRARQAVRDTVGTTLREAKSS